MADQVIHRTKLFNGQAVEEVHFDAVFKGARCAGCGSEKCAIRIQTFIAIADIKDQRVRDEVFDSVLKGKLKPTPTTSGPGVRAGESFACASCRKEAEIAAARCPSYVIVVIDKLVEADKPTIQVV